MKLNSLGANRTELELANGTLVLFSYKTPVAAHVPGEGFYRTDCRWSKTTSKHISQWLSHHGSGNAAEKPQSFFDAMSASAS